MIRSMTAFARLESPTDWGSITWELRSVNHRYLELQFKLPEMFRNLEPKLRDQLRKALNRGKVECQLRYQLNPGCQTRISINDVLLTQLLQACQQIEATHPALQQPSSLDILKWPGVINDAGLDGDAMIADAEAHIPAVLDELLEARQREGEELRLLIEQRLQAIMQHTSELRRFLPTILQQQRARLIERLEDANVDADPNRLEQEMVILAQKSDVDEELDRLDTHVNEVLRVLNKGGPCGRRLDFLMQELNREANTLSSKSLDSQATQSAVELKVLIEQMREQIQNIE